VVTPKIKLEFWVGCGGTLPSDEPGVAKSEEQDGQIPEPLPPELVYDYGGNVETRWEAMSEGGYVTPNNRFYVRNHGPIPKIDARSV
jgi:hypothetical protein